MSKNAMVLDDHFGDDGFVTAGRILKDVPTRRFEELENKSLVREATPEEVKAGDQHQIEADPTKEDGEKKGDDPANKRAPKAANKGA